MWECFAAPKAHELVETVVFNGIVPATNERPANPKNST
jgi:hypothetical protein